MKTTDRFETILMSRKKSLGEEYTASATNAIEIKQYLEKYPEIRHQQVWVSCEQRLTNVLLNQYWSHCLPPFLLKKRKLLMLHEPVLDQIPAIQDAFGCVAFPDKKTILTSEELATVLNSKKKHQLFIGGRVNHSGKTITFWKGDLETITVPFSSFPISGNGIVPEFDKMKMIDYGQTIKLGKYEAATDALLYEMDGEFRKEQNVNLRKYDKSFGASIRRLRKTKHIKQSDFSPLNEKTIARIENNEVKKSSPRTLNIIASRLGVSVEELGEF